MTTHDAGGEDAGGDGDYFVTVPKATEMSDGPTTLPTPTGVGMTTIGSATRTMPPRARNAASDRPRSLRGEGGEQRLTSAARGSRRWLADAAPGLGCQLGGQPCSRRKRRLHQLDLFPVKGEVAGRGGPSAPGRSGGWRRRSGPARRSEAARSCRATRTARGQPASASGRATAPASATATGAPCLGRAAAARSALAQRSAPDDAGAATPRRSAGTRGTPSRSTAGRPAAGRSASRRAARRSGLPRMTVLPDWFQSETCCADDRVLVDPASIWAGPKIVVSAGNR